MKIMTIDLEDGGNWVNIEAETEKEEKLIEVLDKKAEKLGMTGGELAKHILIAAAAINL